MSRLRSEPLKTDIATNSLNAARIRHDAGTSLKMKNVPQTTPQQMTAPLLSIPAKTLKRLFDYPEDK
jgi:hypothetical protein